MAKKKKCPKCPPPAAWMTTYTDMSNLLLAFFILLVALSTIDQSKLREIVSVFTGGKELLETGKNVKNVVNVVPQPGANKEEMMKSLDEYLESQNLGQQIEVVKTSKGFSIRILDSIFFRSGSAELLNAGVPILDRIVSMALDTDYYLSVEGHADDRAGGTVNNWDLSTNRALSVVKYMVSQGMPPDRLSATGYAEFHPLFPNITEANRARNRRVEINFISPEFFESGKGISK